MAAPIPESFDSIFPIGGTNDAFAEYFIGQSYLAPLTTDGVRPRARNR